MKTNSPLPKIDKQFQPLLNRHILKWFMVLISTQQRGDVVSSGKHMGIAVSATEHIAAGEFKVRGVLGNKRAGQHNLKTVHFRETLA
jgi:hypothetical protein